MTFKTTITTLLARSLLLAVFSIVLAVGLASHSQARFLTPDTYDPWLPGVDFNRYAYANDDPVNLSDPNGHQVPEIFQDPIERDALNARNADIHEALAQKYDALGEFDLASEHRALAESYRQRIGVPTAQLAQQEARRIVRSAAVVARGVITGIEAATNFIRWSLPKNGYDKYKRENGPAGDGYEYHHIVEQCQGKCTRGNFPSDLINSDENIVRVPKEVHRAISAHYSRKFSNDSNITIRDWQSTKSFKEQFSYGKQVLKREMDRYEKAKKK